MNLGDIHATPLRGEPPSGSYSTAKFPRLTQTHAKASIELILDEQKEAEAMAERERVAAVEREVMGRAVWEKEMAEKIYCFVRRGCVGFWHGRDRRPPFLAL
jgi:hypothetical protein